MNETCDGSNERDELKAGLVMKRKIARFMVDCHRIFPGLNQLEANSGHDSFESFKAAPVTSPFKTAPALGCTALNCTASKSHQVVHI